MTPRALLLLKPKMGNTGKKGRKYTSFAWADFHFKLLLAA